jgi:Transglycosylase-like domain
VFKRWRFPAALAVAVGIGFSASGAAAASSSGAEGGAAGQHTRAAGGNGTAVGHGGPSILNRPFRRLHRAIDVHVRRIRAQQRRRLERAWANLPGGVSQATLDAIAYCESGGDPTAVSSDGSYRGKYQFDYGTWAAVGGSGDPAAAPEAEQDYRAALLYAQSGSSPWPVCG